MDAEKKVSEKQLMKRRLRNILIICAAVLLVLVVASLIIDRLSTNRKYEEATKNLNYKFAEADFDENIYDDPAYLELIENGFLYFCDTSNNQTIGYEREEAEKFGADVVFMTEYIYAAIGGEHEKYNAMFSDLYYDDNAPLEKFTMQKIYDVTITRSSERDVTDKKNTYREYKYTVEYKILDNNGTFRNDIATGSRKQNFTVTDREGELKIDAIGVNLN